jgi:nucleoside-diphosphate-sugar epimerase
MKAFVAGGTGFIGSHIIDNLIRKGIQVRALVRNSSNTERLTNGRIEFVYGDVLDSASLKKHIRDIDLVFSAFGILGQWGMPEQTYRNINTKGLKNLIESCLDSDIKQFIHISSAGVLGPLPDGVVADESFPYNPSNLYEETKCEAEKEIISFAKREGLPVTIVRPEFVYGPGDIHVLGLFKAVKAGKFFILGNGRSLLHPTYIDDLIQGISLCTDNKAAFGKTFLITGEKPISVEDLAKTIAEELGVSLPKIKIPIVIANTAAVIFELGTKVANYEPLLTISRVRFFTENRSFTCRKAGDELGYVPRVGFKEGVRRTVCWYRDNGYL